MIFLLSSKKGKKTFLFIVLVVVLIYLIRRNILSSVNGRWNKSGLIGSLFQNEKTKQNRYVSLSVSTQNSMSDSYMFYIPIACLAWRRLGFEPVVIMVQPEYESISDHYNRLLKNKTLLMQELKASQLREKVVDYLNQISVKVINLKAPENHLVFVGMLARVFVTKLADDYFKSDEDFILLSDTDLIPVKKEYYEFNQNEKSIKIWSAYCCSEFEYRNKNYTMFAMSHIGMTKGQWSQLVDNYNASTKKFTFREKQNCFLFSCLTSSEKPDSTTDHPSLLKLGPKYNSSQITSKVIDIFGKEHLNSEFKRGSIKWFTDQRMVSILVNEFLSQANIGTEKKIFTGWRLDRAQSSEDWYKTVSDRFETVTDSHLYDDRIFEDINLLRVLNKRLFSNDVNIFIDKYLEEYTAIRNIYNYILEAKSLS